MDDQGAVLVDANHHIVPIKIYFAIFAALLVLTFATVQVAFFDLGRMNTVIALAIAVLKATLVILYFMHVKYSPGLTKLVIAGALLWFALLILLTLGDYLTRGWLKPAAP